MYKVKGTPLSQGLECGRIVVFGGVDELHKSIDKQQPIVIAAHILTPKETIAFKKFNIKGIIVEAETETSHVTILSRVMGIPSVTGININNAWNGHIAIVNGLDGTLIIEPDNAEMLNYEHLKSMVKIEREDCIKYISRKTETTRGQILELYANITSEEDVEGVIKNGAEGIGNFKTEFIFMESEGFPSEEEQFDIYRNVAERMSGKKVVIRTIDLGADKTPSYIHLGKEENPALGYRAIRFCLDNPEIFYPQIRAILRASAYGNISIMYPMVVSVEEVIKIKKIIKNVSDELTVRGIPHNDRIEQGIMVETPAAVIISDDLAREVDFFSIGTNDLTQYMLAADRHNDRLKDICNPYHPAVLAAIRHIVFTAHKNGIWVSISGELGADERMLEFFLDIGIDALTVSPNKILRLRKLICEK